MQLTKRDLIETRNQARKLLAREPQVQLAEGLRLLQKHGAITAKDHATLQKYAGTPNTAKLDQMVESDVARILALIMQIEDDDSDSEQQTEAMSGTAVGVGLALFYVGASLLDGPMPFGDIAATIIIGGLLGAAYDEVQTIGQEPESGEAEGGPADQGGKEGEDGEEGEDGG